ncbi:hypothetical protein MMC15_002139 [Xylographa vitiligo]|nr:hypothetical protein [Xylographa vitiligo]
MHILKVLGGVALLRGGGLNVLAHPTTNEVQRREPTSLGMLGDYTIVLGTWVGPITPGGPNVNITGQLQDVHKKILEMNPLYDPKDFGHLNDGHGNITNVAKRNAIVPPNCNVPYPAARTDFIDTCILWAEGTPGAMCIPPGPRVCLVMTGNDDAIGCNTIYVCNDNSYEICPQSAYLAGNYAQRIVDGCTYSSNGVSYVRGQEFDTDGYNVIVSGDCSSGPASKRDEPASHEVQRREPDTLGMIGDYKIISPTWVGPIVPGGPNVTLTGRSFHVSVSPSGWKHALTPCAAHPRADPRVEPCSPHRL